MEKGHTLCYVQSDNSIKNSMLKAGSIKGLLSGTGYSRAVLADDGLCTGVFQQDGPFGVKAFVSSDAQVLLLPKNYKGYQKLSRLLSDAGSRLQDCRGVLLPVVDVKDLEKGDVICIVPAEDGPAAILYDRNEALKRTADALAGTLPGDLSQDAFMVNSKRLEDVKADIKDLEKRIRALKQAAEEDVDKKAYGLSLLLGISLEEARKEHEADYRARDEARRELKKATKQLARKKRERDGLAEARKETKKEHDEKAKLLEEYDRARELVLPDEEVDRQAKKVLQEYREAFGDDLYVGISPYGDRHGSFGMKACALQSVHMAAQDQLPWWQSMRALRLKTWDNIGPGDRLKYLLPYEEFRQKLAACYGQEAADRALEAADEIGDQLRVVFPETENYPRYRDENGNIVPDAPAILRELAAKGARERLGALADTQRYQQMLEHELGVIIELGFADYLLIVSDFIRYAKELSRKKDPSGLGEGVGPGRGSGAGSLVNYCLYITDLDPIKYDLRFERFLNKERVSMPDIDTDFSQEVRPDAIDYVRRKYGQDCVKMISTCLTQAPKLALRNAGKVQDYYLTSQAGHPVSGDGHYSSFSFLGQEMGQYVDKDVKSLEEVEGFLREKYKGNANALMILDRAMATEDLMVGTSVHAAGVIIGTGQQPLKDLVPLMDSRAGADPGSPVKTVVEAVQCDMNVAESKLKLLKMDFLGLIYLDFITDAIRLIFRQRGVRINIKDIPVEREVLQEFARGNTAYVFQFESEGMRRMLKQFRPTSFEDLILLVAAYRPGPMDSIPDIIDVKHGRKRACYSIPELEPILGITYGKPIYQEQLMDIFHMCAGFSLGEADIIRRYMSKKKVDKFMAYKPKFVEGFMTKGGTREAAEAEWASYENFARYAFNKSHAAVYAWISYVTAYLKHHFGTEYMCAVLNKEKMKKLPKVLEECRRMGVRVLPPDINASAEMFRIEGDCIRFGLSRIRGFQKDTAQKILAERQKGFFNDYRDFLLRTDVSEKDTSMLVSCGCFDGCGKYRSRAVMIDEIDMTSALLRSYREISDKETSDAKRRLKAECRQRFLREQVLDGYAADDAVSFLAEETRLLGACLSRDPLEPYLSFYQDGHITKTDALEAGSFTVAAGIVSGLRVKEDRDMMFFDITDPAGTVSCACFRDAGKFRPFAQNGSFVLVTGRAENREWDGELSKQIIVNKVEPRDAVRPIRVYVQTAMDAERYIRSMSPYVSQRGRPVVIHSQEAGQFVETPIKVFPTDAGRGPCYYYEY